ncbi:putative conjugal transfer protein precursor [Gluconacetobacter diazotrophicus PA1 5]|uniref:Putative conjugal transfer protein n=1 Tax=Gluconacetobacter diazotrophicus (strain ATCC 49037 / DSM 5601 / CCUG 37298 / CIP 103539 / LMG 7603 / PAl5) TaxID=272568 RepID=A9HQG6_GLUDA|nr:putative conjugal transfer protein precursor [Gluconacetobacter diazotrophicus PA1 5]
MGASLSFHPTPRWVWNETASVPVGLYRIQPTVPVRVGDIVAIRLPEREATLLASRGYLPFGVPLLKPVAALAGQSVCRIGVHVTIDGKAVGDAKTVDHRGRKLPVWQGCQHLGLGQVFVMNAAVPTSLDGRYFGVLPMDIVIGRAVPVHVRTGEAEPPPPHFAPFPEPPEPMRERPLLAPPMMPMKSGEPPIQ